MVKRIADEDHAVGPEEGKGEGKDLGSGGRGQLWRYSTSRII